MDFNVEVITEKLVKWVREWFENNGPGCNAIIGISGGKDSAVAAAICVEALGRDRVLGVLMPNGLQPDIDYAKMLVYHLGIRSFTINIHEAYLSLLKAIGDGGNGTLEFTPQALTNLPPRIRMTTLYAVSQSMNGRVINTCNLSEDWVGYSTRYGDTAGDVSPLSHLTVEEVKAIGHYLGLPEDIVEKAPADGLTGNTDEDNLGFTYSTLDNYIRNGECEDLIQKVKIDSLHEKNLFKLKLMDSPDFGLPVNAE